METSLDSFKNKTQSTSVYNVKSGKYNESNLNKIRMIVANIAKSFDETVALT